MADLAELGMRFESQEAETANQRLDRLAETADRTEKATDRLTAASSRADSAIARMVASIEKSVRETSTLARAQHQAAEAARLAAEAERAVEAARAKAAAEASKQARAVADLEQRMRALKASVDPVGAAQDRLNAEMQEASALYRAGAISAEQYAQAMRVLDDRYRMVTAANDKSAKAMRGASLAGLGLSRQFADIGVTAAMGMNPLMILIQQGPQIADQLALMKMEGIGLGAAFRSMFAAAAPALPLLGGIGAVAAVGFGAAALAARKLDQDNKDLVKSLGLTEKQLKHLKEKGVDTGVTIGDVFRGTFNYIRDAIGPILAPVAKWFSDLFDNITKWSVAGVKAVVKGYAYAATFIIETWGKVPEVVTDVAITASNAVLRALEGMINKAIPMLNSLVDKANSAAESVGLAIRLPSLDSVSLGQIANPYKGSFGDADAAARGAAERAGQKVDEILGGLGKAIVKAAEDRIKKAAGDPGKIAKGPAAPRDMTDERVAQLAQQIAQARQDELQATLAVTREIRPRAALEREILAFQVAEKQAQIDGQIARLADEVAQKKISAVEAEKLALGYADLKARAAITGLIQQRAINEREVADLAAERLETEQAARQNAIDLLGAQANSLQSAYARAAVDIEILRHQQEMEKATLRAVTVANGATEQAEADAKRKLKVLDQIHALQLEQAKRETRLVNALGEATSAVRGFKDAFRRHDWARVFDELQRTIETIQASFAANGLSGGLLTAGSAAASLIGGRGGRIAGNALGIAGLGMGIGTLATGASLGSVGLVTGLTGSAALGGAVGSGLAALGAAAPPLALAAAALYAAAKIFNIGGKPTNAGAGYDLRTGAVSGNKRTEETEGAARSAGEAIQGIMDAVKAAGIGLTDAVTGLVIGTRDQTQIYLQSGKTLLSAVGDSGAAVDTAMRALLEGATYASAAQKKLVDSALAAGKGFDAISEILASYEAAQKISGNLGSEILRLTDPKAFDLKAVRDDIEAQRTAYAKLAEQGYLTADQLGTITGQLATLEGLRIDEVMKRYAEAVNGATNATELSRQKLSMEAQIARLRGQDDIATGIEHALVLDQMDESLHATQKLLWAEQALAEQREKAAADAKRLQSLEERLLSAKGDDVSAAQLRQLERQRELIEAANDNERILLRRIYAQEDVNAANDNLERAQQVLVDSYNREAEALKGVIDRFGQLGESLGEFRRSLFIGQAARLNPFAQYRAARNELIATSAAANRGDEGALGRFQGVAQSFLQASQGVAGSGAFYSRDLALVRKLAAQAEAAAKAQISDAQRQLDAMTAQVSELVTLNRNVTTVEAAVTGVNASITALAAAEAEANRITLELVNRPPPAPVVVVNSDPALLTELAALRGQVTSLTAETERGSDASENAASTLRRVSQGGTSFSTSDSEAA